MAAFLAFLTAAWVRYQNLPAAFHVITWLCLAFCFGWVSGCTHEAHHLSGK